MIFAHITEKYNIFFWCYRFGGSLRIKRLGISPNILFYPDATEVEQAAQHLLGKLMACTEDERQIILTTLDCMAEELIKRHQKLPNSDLN